MSSRVKKTLAVVVSMVIFFGIFAVAAIQNYGNNSYFKTSSQFQNSSKTTPTSGPITISTSSMQAAPYPGGFTSPNGISANAPSTSQSTSVNPYDLLVQDVKAFCSAINASPDSAFKYPSANRKKTLCNKLLHGFLGEIQAGNFTAALDQLDEIRSKMDGDPGHVDKSQGKGHHKQPHYAGNDWVVNASIRNNLTQYIDNIENADYDNDGLSFQDEVSTHGTDPLNPDTDGDGMPDGWEVNNGFDPLDPSDGVLDADGDLLMNLEENMYGTDPQDPDTDDDSVNGNFLDGTEVRYWRARGLSVQTAGQYANTLDVDGDGLIDGREAYIGSQHVYWFEAEDFPANNAFLINDTSARYSPSQQGQAVPKSAVSTTHSSGELVNISVQLGQTQTDFPGNYTYHASWMHPAVGDVNNDGQAEIVLGQGPTAAWLAPPIVNVTDIYGNPKGYTVTPYSNFIGGVFVATGDVDGDGDDEIVTGPGIGGSALPIRIYNFTDSNGFQLLHSFTLSWGTTGINRGINVACGDVDNDGADEVIATPAYEGPADVYVYDINVNTNQIPWQYSSSLFQTLNLVGYARHDPNFNGGQYVSSGDVNGDNFDEIVVTCWSNGDENVTIYSGSNNNFAFIREFTTYTGWIFGVRTAVGDVSGDGKADIITTRKSGQPDERIYDAFGTLMHQFLGFNYDFGYPLGFGRGAQLAAGNMSGDGKAEILVSPVGTDQNVKGYEVLFAPTPGTYRLYVKAKTSGGASSLRLKIVGSDAGLPNQLVFPVTNYRWFNSFSFTVTRHFEMHAIVNVGTVWVDKIALVRYDDSQAFVGTTSSNQLQFNSPGFQIVTVDLPILTQSVPSNSTGAFLTIRATVDQTSMQYAVVDVADDGDVEWSGALHNNNPQKSINDFSGTLTEYVLNNLGQINNGRILVPINITCNHAGIVQLLNIWIQLGPDISDNADFDTDSDGLWDGWQDKNNNNIFDSGEEGEKGDGAGNYALGTHAFDWDTDNDASNDGSEPAQGTNVFDYDSDNDMISDGSEPIWGTNPLIFDHDGDNLPDGWEVGNDPDNMPQNTFGLNPLLLDTDNDGTNDDSEDMDNDGLNNLGEYQSDTDPNNADTDGDGANDGPEVNVHNTNPLIFDTDADGMPDGYEITFGLNPLVNDAQGDLDGDTLTNIQEFQLGTFPNNQDTDGDLMTDDWEVAGGGTGLEDPTVAWDPNNLVNLANANLPQHYFALHLVVSFEWDEPAGSQYTTDFITGMLSASDFLYRATDGYLLIGNVTIFDNGQNWNTADIRVYQNHNNMPIPGTPSSDVLGILPNAWTVSAGHTYFPGRISMPDIWNVPNVGNFRPNHPNYWRTIVHELGHYAMGLLDEYYDASGSNNQYPDNNNDGAGDGPPSIMTSQFNFGDMSTPWDYNPQNPNQWTPPNDAQGNPMMDTHQHANPNHVWPINTANWWPNPNAGESCWDTFFKYYNNNNGLLQARMGGRNYCIFFDLDGDGNADAQIQPNYVAFGDPPNAVLQYIRQAMNVLDNT